MNFRQRMRKIHEINLDIVKMSDSSSRTTEGAKALIQECAKKIEQLSIEDPRNCDACGTRLDVCSSYVAGSPCNEIARCDVCRKTIRGRDWGTRRKYILKWLEGQKERCQSQRG